MKTQTQIPASAYKAGGFIKRYQTLVSDTVIPYQYNVLWDREKTAEKSHVVANFINAAKALKGEDVGDGFYGMVFQDSDAYKWLEAVAFSLTNRPDAELERKADELIEFIVAAQDEDGYLNTYFTIKDRDKRWTNILEAHELYCSGHMIEAACAYYEATGKDTFLNVAIKNAEHIYDIFITKNHPGASGHPEVELALMKLYRITKNPHFLELAKHFIDVRGTDQGFYADEAAKRDWQVWGMDPWDNAYRQADKPVRELSEATGHAVRAVYLYTAMADLAAETDDPELLEACKRLWENITQKKMYITGGIGSSVIGEAFTINYDLPNDTAYSETCAAIGLMFFANQMLGNDVNGKYADIQELSFYNTVLAGMQLDGKRFFYVNPLEVNLGITGNANTQRHVLPSRPGWYACACCPPNVARLIGSIGKYAYGENNDTVYCHMYAAGSVNFSNGMKLSCATDYPYDMNVKYTVLGTGKLAIRIPKWSKNYTVLQNGVLYSSTSQNGYVYMDVDGETSIELTLDSSPRFVRANSGVPRLTGMTALMRGPLVYCFESADNENIRALLLDKTALPTVSEFNPDLLGGTVTLSAKAYRVSDCEGLYSDESETLTKCMATAIPYYTWGNRGENDMRVWMNAKA